MAPQRERGRDRGREVPMIRLEPVAGAEPFVLAAEENDERPAGADRRRRITWALVVVILLAQVAVAATAIVRHGVHEVRRASARFASTVGPLRFDAYAPPSVPDADNAALPILEALDALCEDDGPDGFRGTSELWQLNRRPAAEWTEDDRSFARERLEAARALGVLDPLDEAARRPASSFRLDYAAGPRMEIPPLFRAAAVRELLLARASLAWWDDTPADGLAAVSALDALSRALEREGPLIFQVVGYDVEEAGYRAIRGALEVGGGATDPELLRALRELTGERPRIEGLRRTLGADGTLLHGTRPGGPYARAVVASRPWYDRLLYLLLGHDSVADGLDYFADVAEAAPGLVEGRTEAPPEHPDSGRFDLPVTDLRSILREMRETESLRRSTRVDLDRALGRALAEAAPSGDGV